MGAFNHSYGRPQPSPLAAVGALRSDEGDGAAPRVGACHFERAFDHVFPSVSPQDEQSYLKVAAKLRRSRAPKATQAAATPAASATNGGVAPAELS